MWKIVILSQTWYQRRHSVDVIEETLHQFIKTIASANLKGWT